MALGRWFVTRYGTKQGILVIGRVAPFGIGAVIGGGGNLVVGRSVIAGMSRAFGPPPAAFGTEPDDSSEHTPNRLASPRVFAGQPDETASGQQGW